MKPQQVNHYNTIPLNSILQQCLINPQQSKLYFICFAKAKLESCDPYSIEMVLKLLEVDGDKWLGVIERFAELQFKLVFSLCVKNIKTYPTLIGLVHLRGEVEHQAYLEQRIEEMLDNLINHTTPTINYQIWDIYIQYLSSWTKNLPHRTFYALQKIQSRLSQKLHVYDLVNQFQRVQFIIYAAKIISFHEDCYMRKLELRRFWESIPGTIAFLKLKLTTDQGLILQQGIRLVQAVQQSRQHKVNYFNQAFSHTPHTSQLQTQLENILSFFTQTCQVSILQQLYLQCCPTLCKKLIKVHIINYSSYSPQDMEQAMQLQSNLIYNYPSDDFGSMFQQLISVMVAKVPNFLTVYYEQCAEVLMGNGLGDQDFSDAVLKLCIISKPLVQYSKTLPHALNIRQLIQKIQLTSQSKSQLIQIKVLKLMHYFKQLLPQSNYLRYHNIIFSLLKSSLLSQISMRAKDQLGESMTLSQSVCFKECVKILEEETERPEKEKLETKIRKKKFTNEKYATDLFQKHQLWMTDKLMDLLAIQGYCEGQNAIFELFKNIMEKYSSIQARNTVCLLKMFSKHFVLEYQRLLEMNFRDRLYSKILLILNCICLVVDSINQETYCDCQEYLAPVIETIKFPHMRQLEDSLVDIIEKLIHSAQTITPGLSNFVIYSKQVLVGGSSTISSLEGIIKALCTKNLINSVTQDWPQIVTFFTGIFIQYFTFLANDSTTVSLYQRQHTSNFHSIQLFLQSYQDLYSTDFQLSQNLIQVQYIVQKIPLPQPVLQTLMTIHHMVSKCKLHPLPQLFNLTLYTQRYSLHMIQLTLTDILVKNLRNRIFDFEHLNNQVYQFIQQFNWIREEVSSVYFNLKSTPNDTLPLARVRLDSYIEQALIVLRKDRLIDVQEFSSLSLKLVDNRFLINQGLFQ